MLEGKKNSRVITSKYILGERLEPPVADLKGQIFNEKRDISINLSCPEGSEIRFTTDGNEPSYDTGKMYEKTLKFTIPVTLKAVSVKKGKLTSDVMTEYYGVRKIYKLREKGPAGGIVFYDKGSYTNGWRFMEVAPPSTEWTSKIWSEQGQSVDKTKAGIGYGKSNTERIISASKGAGKYSIAASLCGNMKHKGFNDWYLPSKDELKLISDVVGKNGLGGFSSGYYWSSTEESSSSAWLCNVNKGAQVPGNKNGSLHVRAVRRF